MAGNKNESTATSSSLLGACAIVALHKALLIFLFLQVYLIRQLFTRPYPALSIFQDLSSPANWMMHRESEKWYETSNQMHLFGKT